MTIPQNNLYGGNETEIDIIDLKITPELGSILQTGKGYYPAYHMNKEHWITVDLSAIDNFDQLGGMIDDSYELTR
ncbi:MmcQ/YjbR family DNA-binding protein [Secundilactobacillus malefermentans]|uniref:MmcQ/YjbR family DNA-binding protein n=1 Tax=Secundilactobacillus malefermentans TaxID=176292 RepID=UPI00164EF613|nr:MmcQ/YjbR family DNA-binding protein [Secundilactobacillus malefermentans]